MPWHDPCTRYVRRPFWDKRVDMLDCVCCLSILLHVESTLYYWNPLFVNLGSGGAEQLDGLLVAANVICVLHMFGLFFLTLIEHRFRHSRSLRQTMKAS